MANVDYKKLPVLIDYTEHRDNYTIHESKFNVPVILFAIRELIISVDFVQQQHLQAFLFFFFFYHNL